MVISGETVCSRSIAGLLISGKKHTRQRSKI
jgi:hypothetical protein